MFTVRFSKQATRLFRRLPRNRKAAILAALDGFSEASLKSTNVRKLYASTYRVRVGSYRVFVVVEEDGVAVVTWVGTRQDAPY